MTASPGRVRLDVVDYAGSNSGGFNPAQALSWGAMLATGLEGNQHRCVLVSVAGRQVVIRARSFGTQVPVRVLVAPENGPTVTLPAVMDGTTQTPAATSVSVPIPANSPVKINVWTR